MQDIPCGGTAVERAYRELLETLLSRCRALEQAGRRERREALDYYTMWLHQIKTPIEMCIRDSSWAATERNFPELPESGFRKRQAA